MSHEIDDYAERVSDELLEELRPGALWSSRSMDAAAEALQWPVGEIAVEMVQRADYGRKIQEIFKMLLISSLRRSVRRGVDRSAATSLCVTSPAVRTGQRECTTPCRRSAGAENGIVRVGRLGHGTR